jgi:hypothetical protein
VPKSNSNNQVKKFSSNKLGRKPTQENNTVLDSVNKQHIKTLQQTDGGEVNTRKYQIYCNKRHLLYITREEFYKTVVKGHVITTLRINDFTTFGFEKKTDVGEKRGAN